MTVALIIFGIVGYLVLLFVACALCSAEHSPRPLTRHPNVSRVPRDDVG